MSYENTNPGQLREVQLSTLSPVMWAEGRTYPRKTMSVPIHPYDPSFAGLGGCCGGIPYWNRSNSVANVRPIGFGTDDSAWAGWRPWVLFSIVIGIFTLAFLGGPTPPVVPWR